MKIVEKIKDPIYQEMELFEKKFAQMMSSKVPLLNRITYFIVKRKGKQIRPMLVFLVAKMIYSNKVLGEKSYRGASILELIHTATLVHDDIIDDSNQRRGFFSINALWKNKIAVLVGDYLLSKGLIISVENKDYDLLKIVSDVVREMSEGELLQIESPESSLELEDLKSAINDAIEALPADLRTAFTLREFSGLSYEDITEIMNCPVGTVRSRIFRAREAIDIIVKELL